MLARLSLRGAALLACVLAVSAGQLHAFEDQFAWGHPTPQGNSVNGIAFRDATRGWAVGGGGTILATSDGGQSWTLQHGPDRVTGDLNDVEALVDGTLIAVGTHVHRSIDDGLTWSVVPSPAAGELRDVTQIPGGGISAAGEDGSVIRSFDAGQTWAEAGSLAGTVRHHLWRSADEGYAVGEGVSHRTTDGGQTWTQITDLTAFGFNEVYFTDAQHGTIVEDFGTWRSDDGGATWTEFFAPLPPLYRYRTLVLSPTHLLTVAFIEGGELWETTDGGANWTQLQDRRITGFPSLTQTPGGRVIWGSDIGDIYWSDDLGHTYENATENLCTGAPFAPFTDILRRPDGVLFAANQPSSGSDTQTWLRSDDEGESWFEPAAAPGFRWIDAGGFLDQDRGLVTYRSDVRRTDDGGETWQSAALAEDRRAWSAALVAADRYFLATSSDAGGDLLRSTDGGVTWLPVAGGLPTVTFAASAVSFADAVTGFVSGTVGSTSRLYRTVDGGQSWHLRAGAGLPALPSDMHWFDADTGLAAVNYFAGPGVYRTVDGGQTWHQVSDVRSQTLVFRDAVRGVALGMWDETFLATDDAGSTWTEESLPLHAPGPGFNIVQVSAAAPRTDGWVFGASGGRIMVATAGDLTGVAIESAGDRAPTAACRLLGATPNPFNPTTTIAFEMPVAGAARITVHDLAGRRVRRLLADDRAAGRHEIRWDGRDDAGAPVAAGVYLVRAAGPGGSDHGKITLVK